MDLVILEARLWRDFVREFLFYLGRMLVDGALEAAIVHGVAQNRVSGSVERAGRILRKRS